MVLRPPIAPTQPPRSVPPLWVLLGVLLGIAPSAANTTQSGATSLPSGARAVRILFNQNNPKGSFDAPPPNGTPAVPGSGLRATRVFNPDGSLLANATSQAANWPKWLTSFEIGISGSNNASAPDPDCARFAKTAEDTDNQCDWDQSGSAFQPCGAPPGLFRVSEWDCADSSPSITSGNGGPNDGIYLRATFSRNSAYLGASENLMATLEYSASTIQGGPSDPTTCFTDGIFTPQAAGCSDQVWQTYLKNTQSEITQPFLMLIPPAYQRTQQATNTSGTGISTKQIILPLSAYPDATVFQISRIKGRARDATFDAICNPTSASIANSALCVGVVLHSITFYRM